MTDKQYEIVKRSNGYWIYDKTFGGYLNGPYETMREASKDVPSGQVQYPLPLENTND